MLDALRSVTRMRSVSSGFSRKSWPRLRRLDRRLDGSVPADHDDDGVGVVLLQSLERLEPVDAAIFTSMNTSWDETARTR